MIRLIHYNAHFAQLCTGRGSHLYTVSDLLWIAEHHAEFVNMALALQQMQSADDATRPDNEPPTVRDGSASTWPAPTDERGADDVLRGKE